MGKSLNRVKAALVAAGHDTPIVETGTAKTAQQAADELGCVTDQIAKSIILEGTESSQLFLFLTAGSRQVDLEAAQVLAGEDLQKADANKVRKTTGFAIGGVSPLGHLTAPVAFMDSQLLRFETIWAAAGTPIHVFEMPPNTLKTAANAKIAPFSN